jgi:WD40 repeat protein
VDANPIDDASVGDVLGSRKRAGGGDCSVLAHKPHGAAARTAWRWWFALSPNERWLATSLGDGSTQLWDPASGRPIGTPLPRIPGSPGRAAFVADGTGLVTIGRDGRGDLWDLRPASWARRACAIAGRTLSRSEWRNALPERRYAPACTP